MKANQAFRQDDEAVSPVIGVILMVAITVVLAAVVFVLVTRLSGDEASTTPNFGFTPDNAAKTIRVTTADPGTSWNNIKATVTCSDTATTPDLDRNAANVVLVAGVADPVHASDTVNAGSDVLAVSCTGAGAGDTVTLVLTWKPSNTQIGATWTFIY
jgi:archaeal type IV pilus assembly protein PilA